MEIFTDLETFIDLIKTEIYYFDVTEQAIIDAYNHIEETEDGWKCNVNGVRIWFNEIGEVTNFCTKLHPVNFNDKMIGIKNHKLEIEMRDKGVYYE